MEELTVNTNELDQKVYPLVALRGKVLFPKTILNFDAGRPLSVAAIDAAAKTDNIIMIASQKDVFIDSPRKNDIATVGTIAKIKQVVKLPGGNLKVTVESLERAKIREFVDTKGYYAVRLDLAPYVNNSSELEIEAYLRVSKAKFFEYAMLDKRTNKEMVTQITSQNEPNSFIDNALSVVPFKEQSQQAILDIDNTLERLIAFKALFEKEIEIKNIENKITKKVKDSIDKSQKEFYLREQIRAIHDELGDGASERELLVQEIKAKNLPEEIENKALKEIERLDKINPSSPDYSVILNYLDWIKELPFNTYTEDTEDLSRAREILDGDHFGLVKVKQRIMEYLSVLKLTKSLKGPILCFVGPPGVGKTSVATSIARALNRKFVRMSLGGVKDEAEIRGHRKTYVGAMPGRIIYGLKNAGSANPVFLLDEIDKLSSDIHGDPASALLEVLDPEQNATFRDRFLEVPFDLSKVMFITTANSLDSIPYPLLDRMEIIEINGYTEEEKLQIAKRYLVPKQVKQNGLTDKKIEITDDSIKEVIEGYTKEAGVRNLEREIGSIVRKVASKVAENSKTRKQTVTAKKVFDYLGVKKYMRGERLVKDEIGACTGLAWTAVGGTTLTIEVSLMQGSGEVMLTGKLGDVMKESAKTAISYIRSNAEKYNIDAERFSKTDIHIHVPEGATPKDGPSAGITMATAILSAFIKKSVKKNVAMTGEITLRGNVLAIGGLKEKALAGFREGIKTIIIPKANDKDLTELPQEIINQIKFIKVETVEQVFKEALNF